MSLCLFLTVTDASEIRLDGKREQTEFVGKSVKGAYLRYAVIIRKARSDRFGTFFGTHIVTLKVYYWKNTKMLVLTNICILYTFKNSRN